MISQYENNSYFLLDLSLHGDFLIPRAKDFFAFQVFSELLMRFSGNCMWHVVYHINRYDFFYGPWACFAFGFILLANPIKTLYNR